jgi:putative ABC transport system ATP-binding protein
VSTAVTETPEQGARRARPTIQVRRLVKTYEVGPTSVHALRGLSFDVERGEFVAVMGTSGSGKTTLMNILGCLDTPTRGAYRLDGIDIRLLDDYELAQVRNRKIGFVFQSYNLIPRTSALQNVELPLVYARLSLRERRRRAEEALRAVGLAKRMHHLPSELSGGQQQRVAVARAIVTNPALLLADEPTGNLDSLVSAEILRIFSALNEQGRTIVIITHETEVAAAARRVITLRDGRITDDRRRSPLAGPAWPAAASGEGRPAPA